MVSLHSFLDHIEVSLKFILGRECIDIDPLHYIPLLVASPVCSRSAPYLESNSHELPGILNVRSSAEIHIVITGVVYGELLILGKILNDLCLEFLIPEHLKSIGLGDLFSSPVFLSLDDLVHFSFDNAVIFLCDRTGKNEIVVAAVGYLRSYGILYILFAVDLDDRFSQNVGY